MYRNVDIDLDVDCYFALQVHEFVTYILFIFYHLLLFLWRCYKFNIVSLVIGASPSELYVTFFICKALLFVMYLSTFFFVFSSYIIYMLSYSPGLRLIMNIELMIIIMTIMQYAGVH